LKGIKRTKKLLGRKREKKWRSLSIAGLRGKNGGGCVIKIH